MFILVSPRVKLNMGLVVPAALLFLCELLLPFKLLGSVYADVRLWPVIFQIALLSPVPGSIGRGGDAPDRGRRRDFWP